MIYWFSSSKCGRIFVFPREEQSMRNLQRKVFSNKNYFWSLAKFVGILVILVFGFTSSGYTQGETLKIKLDTNSPFLVVDEPQKAEIKVGLSHEEEKKLAQAGRIREIPLPPLPDPNLGFKREVYARAGRDFAVPPEIIEAVHQVESGKSWGTNRRSSAGATGPMQFLPSTWRKYATDANGDGQASIYDPEDAIFGAANLLAQAGAAEGDVKRALFAYNHSTSYVEKVLRIAREIGYN